MNERPKLIAAILKTFELVVRRTRRRQKDNSIDTAVELLINPIWTFQTGITRSCHQSSRHSTASLERFPVLLKCIGECFCSLPNQVSIPHAEEIAVERFYPAGLRFASDNPKNALKGCQSLRRRISVCCFAIVDEERRAEPSYLLHPMRQTGKCFETSLD